MSDAIHGCEYGNVQRPIDPRTQSPIEPAHRFEVSLEPNTFTEEKSGFCILLFVWSRLSSRQICCIRELSKKCARRTRNEDLQVRFQKVSVFRDGSDGPGSSGEGAETRFLSSVLSLRRTSGRSWSVGPSARMCELRVPDVGETNFRENPTDSSLRCSQVPRRCQRLGFRETERLERDRFGTPRWLPILLYG